jgi:hypothetical protein
MRTQSSTLYQQIKAIAEVDEHRLVMYRNDLYQVDRTMLKTVKLGDEWIWILRECGTNIMHRPLSYAAELLREGTSEYDSKITNLLQQNADWLSAVIHEQVDSRINKARIFYLVCSLDGNQTVREISADSAKDLMRPDHWRAFLDWREAVLAEASRMSCDIPGSEDWWNTTSIGWTGLDWLEHHRAAVIPEAKADPKAYAKKIAALAIEAMKSAAVLSTSGENQQC